MDDAHSLQLRPDRQLVGLWGAFGLVAVGLGWGRLSLGVTFFGLTFVMVSLAVAGYFLTQLLAPAQFDLTVDRVGIRGRWLWRRLQVPWELVSQAQVSHVAGEMFLRLRLEQGQDVSLLLPFGADVAALHDTLASHLGVAGSVANR